MTSSLAPPPPRFEVRRDPRAPVAVGLLAAAGTVVLGLGDPNTTHVPLCPLKALTGIDCPFCGSLRAVHSLTRLDLAGAADHNLLFTVAAPFLVLAWVVWLLRATGRPVLPRLQLPRTAEIAFAVLAAAFMLARNLPALAWLGSGA